jgi:hypothetical protein
MDYNFYLFSRLVLDAGLIDKELEYDWAFEDTSVLYDSFTDSIFDDGNKDLYGCILEFIEWKKIVNAN